MIHFINFTVNFPVLNLALNIPLGLLLSTLIIFEIFPFTTLPHVVLVFLPMVIFISLWPTVSTISNYIGGISGFIGPLLLVWYYLPVSFIAAGALFSFGGFKELGRTAGKQRVEQWTEM